VAAQNGKNAYLGSGSGGDVLYALDISNPANPVVTDSVISNTRRVNDVMTFPDGKFLVFTREGRERPQERDRHLLSEDPAHPKPIAEFTDGVTGGVHSAFVYKQDKYGTFIFLTNDGTGRVAHHRRQRPVSSEGSGALEDRRTSRRGPFAARHRPA
jgi:hypothetical protein